MLAQIPGIPTPPADSPVSFLGWALAVAMGVAILIWRIREGERTTEIANLKAQHAVDEQEKSALRTRIDKMQEDKVAAANKAAEDSKKLADVIMRARDNVRSARANSDYPPPAAEDDWGDIPTGVSNAIVQRAIDESKSRYDQAPASVPLPRPQPPPREPSRQPRQTPQRITEEYRPRQKSRHDR